MPKATKTPPKPKANKPRNRSDGSANAGKGTERGSKGLTPRQSLFVLEYLKDQNASAAYKRAGYTADGHSADSAAARLLTNVEVAKAIEDGLTKLRQKVEEETGISLKRVIEEIAKGAFFDPRKMFNEDGSPKQITDLPDAEASALAGFEVLEQFEGAGQDRVFVGYLKKFKLSDRKGYLDMLMKHLGGYEQDNKQKVDPLTSLLQGMTRSSLPVAKNIGPDDEA